MKFYIETYGCTANMGNSRETEAALMEMGHLPSSKENADVVIVNTCAVTEKTERRIKRRLRQLQGDRLVIAGCLATALPDALKDMDCRKNVGLLCRSAAQEVAGLFEDNGVLSEDRSYRQDACRQDALRQDARRQDACGIVNIAEGCIGHCSYCLVRKARGSLVSREPGDIADAVSQLVASGCAEIQLAAQDTAAYGLDIGTNLAELLTKINDIPGEFMIRVGMMNPDTVLPILDEMNEAFQIPKVFKFIHIPLQSGSDRILKSMNRRYSSDEFLDIVGSFHESVEDLSVHTDVIAGFPGETEEDFRQTLDIIKLLDPDKVNVTRFSRRPGTPAAEAYDMPDRFKKDRSRRLTRQWMEIAAKKNLRYVGETLKALVTERGRGVTMKARSANYTGIVVPGALKLGCWRKVRIIRSNPFYLEGILLP